tara:strand:- start:1117 stop:1839 length:723 start_codon:yes stop_codon:yes gene_type:complete
MISIDTVYQKVLAFANKEQRGYITPQEFNLFANQAQEEIFEQYFYDRTQEAKKPANSHVFLDVDQSLEEKIRLFEKVYDVAAINTLPDTGNVNVKIVNPRIVYRINKIEFNNNDCELVNTNDFNEFRSGGPLVRPTNLRPIANIRANQIRVIGDNGSLIVPTEIFYFQKPAKVSWGYFVVGGKALHDSNAAKTIDFELHPSEEAELVYKILKYAGISMKQSDISGAGQAMETIQTTQEKR